MTKGKQGLLWLVAGVGAIVGARAVARSRRRYEFNGRIVLIMGGSRGLGLVIARQFASEGARVALAARNAEELERARQDLSAYTDPETYTDKTLTFVCDVTDRAQVEKVISQLKERWGKVDVLVNNAGVIQVGPMETMTLEDYDEAMRIHYWAPLYATLSVLPDMRERGSGRIVNISSIGGKLSVPHLLPYCGSKFALVGLSEGMRSELLKDNIYVTTVCPGLMRTGSAIHAQFKGQHRLEYTWFSLSDSLPFTSVSAESAARQILTACRYGDPEIIISLPAKVAATFHGLFPGATADLFGLCNRILPGPGGIGTERASGMESATRLSPSPLTALSDAAAVRNNESGQ